jgi:divalent metal cation (Fe/Co/Zn/Cd) transporter
MAGILVAAIGIGAAHRLEMPVLDGVASVIIGLILATVALVLAGETRGLLVGEAARAPLVEGVRSLAEEDKAVVDVVRMLTMHVGPEDVLVNLDLRFERDLDAVEVAEAVKRLEGRIKTTFPQVRYLFMEVASITGRREGT